MLKMVWLLHFFFLCLLASGQEDSVKILTLYNSNSLGSHTLSHTYESTAVNLGQDYLNEVSGSILMAENWVRTQVLVHYPSTDVSTILVGHNLLCTKTQDEVLKHILPAVKNIYHSLVRWGLERNIKVSASFPSSCFSPSALIYQTDLADLYFKPLLNFLQVTNSTYSVSPPSHLESVSVETLKLVKSHLQSMRNLGFLDLKKINVVITNPKETKPTVRKLSYIVEPFPSRPTPVSPTHSPYGSSVPAFAAKSPLPPLVGTTSPPPSSHSLPPLVGTILPPPPLSHSLPPLVGKVSPPPLSHPIPPLVGTVSPPPLSHPLPPLVGTTSPPPISVAFPPQLPPLVGPASPPFYFGWPPCNPSGGGNVGAPPVSVPTPSPHTGLWCVAKPSVPADTLQQALDYACGEGGANCDAIAPQGSCYFPDSLVAHASYAFNSYWQRNKDNGGTCGFGGTAMLVNADPSYQQCQFLRG
ncbi:proline-rich receptor-like protein kinase PERK2 [Heracleum sosnowskyi]|uniref:Proline-rich receptor-like protein kinase PERK2 n=1 Tax=Heracleum sosnowskyi TaxID=360622 RepID=A0AAD8HCU4_9APIA|nr:proline-rich receptor-like protein kinase PERK2 [Heracleum sosnowskyi]